MENSDAYSSFLSYNSSQGLSNISLKIIPTFTQEYCKNMSFYNTLNPQVTYYITPLLTQNPILDFSFNDDNSINVTIPSGQ